MSLSAVAMYRLNFILMVVQSILNAAITIACVEFIYGSVNEIAGWSKTEMMTLVCTAQIIDILYFSFIRPNLLDFSESIRYGSFDSVLLKPINIFFRIFVGRIDISSLLAIGVPIFVLLRQLSHIQEGLSLITVLGFIGLLFLGTLVISFIMLAILSLSLVFTNVSQLEVLYYMLMSTAEKPKEIFGRYLGVSLLFILPLIPIANPAASVLLRKATMDFYMKSCAGACVFIILTILCVSRAIRRYESASS